MVKLADTLGSGSSGSNPMGVRVPLRAQLKSLIPTKELRFSKLRTPDEI